MEYEVIIVNDGSTDQQSINAFSNYRSQGYTIVDQANAGLAAARNTGIAHACGDFVLLLDADNFVHMDFLREAVVIMENDAALSVVYSDAEYFGSKTGKWLVGEFNLQRLMIANYIDACAVVRRSVFQELGGYDTAMKTIKSGWEDWEMWLRIAFAGKKFYYRKGIGFKYRVSEDSMIGGIKNSYAVRNDLSKYLHDKYPAYLGHQHITDFVLKRFKPHPFKFIFKLSLLAWANKHYKRLLDKNKIIRGI